MRARDFSVSADCCRPAVALVCRVQWITGFFLRAKQFGHESENSTPAGAEVKDEWSWATSITFAWTGTATFLSY
jgi:hypothetical protein